MAFAPLTLYWNGKPVGRITDWGVTDWPWAAGTFAPTEFPKDFADYLAWRRTQPADDEEADALAIDPFNLSFLAGAFANWSIRFPDGVIHEVLVNRIDEKGGAIEWR